MRAFFTIPPSRQAHLPLHKGGEIVATSVAVGRVCKCQMSQWAFSPASNSGLQPQSKLPAKPVVMIILIIGNDSKSEISDEFCAFANFLFTKKNTYDIIKLQFIIAVYLVR